MSKMQIAMIKDGSEKPGHIEYDPKTGKIEALSPRGRSLLSGTVMKHMSFKQMSNLLDAILTSPDLTSLPAMVTLGADGHTLTITNVDYWKERPVSGAN
jgi:hypothetical protein